MNFKLIKKQNDSEKMIAINFELIKEITLDYKINCQTLRDDEIKTIKERIGEKEFYDKLASLDIGIEEIGIESIVFILGNDHFAKILYEIPLNLNFIEHYEIIENIKELFNHSQGEFLENYIKQINSNLVIEPNWEIMEKVVKIAKSKGKDD